MELKQTSKDKETMEVEVKGENETLLNLLEERLLQDDKVEVAIYSLGHPYLDSPKVYVKVNSGKPQTALKRVAKNIAGEYNELYNLFEKKAKKVKK